MLISQRKASFSSLLGYGLASCAMLAIPISAEAAGIDVGNSDWDVRWDNTVKYSNAFRVSGQDSTVAGISSPNNSNAVQGDRNFKLGLISNRVDLLSEFDAVFQNNTGFRISGAAWYDSVYNQKTDNTDVTATGNSTGPANNFPGATSIIHGKDIELLDALVTHKFDMAADQSLSVKVGRFSQLYGETLFMGGNGIAVAQGPVDIIKAVSVPNSQFKEIMLPVGQFALNWEAGNGLNIGSYYQFEYRKDRLPGVGSYFSDSSIFGSGVETLWAPGSLPNGSLYTNDFFFHSEKSIDPHSQGQGGLEARWSVGKNWEFGLYAANYHEKDPAADYLLFGVGNRGLVTLADGATGVDVGTLKQVYNANVQTYGASFATAVGDTNISGEFSARHNQSLATADTAGGNGQVVVANALSGNGGNSRYLRGDTLHANVSAISLFTQNAIWDGAAFVGELGFNHLIDIINKNSVAAVNVPNGLGGFVTTNSSMSLNPTSTHSALAARAVFEPSFFQVLPNLDITTPVGVGYGIYGRSALGSHLGPFNPESVVDLSFGVKGKYNNVWNASLNYTTYLGPKGQVTAGGNARYLSYAQDMYDRDFVAFSLSRAF